jgi:hypothetical protein
LTALSPGLRPNWQLAIEHCLLFSIGTVRDVNISAKQWTMLNRQLPMAKGGFSNFLLETQLGKSERNFVSIPLGGGTNFVIDSATPYTAGRARRALPVRGKGDAHLTQHNEAYESSFSPHRAA